MEKPVLKLNLTEDEKSLVRLQAIARSGSRNSAKAQSLVTWYLRNHEWTGKQRNLIRTLGMPSDDDVMDDQMKAHMREIMR